MLLPHAEDLLRRSEHAEREFRALARAPADVLHVGTFATAGARLLPQALAELRRRRPAVDVRLAEAEPHDALAALGRGELDVALVFCAPGGPRDAAAHVATRWILDDPMVVMLPAGHALADRSAVELAALADEGWIGGAHEHDPCDRVLVEACRSHGFEPRTAFRSDDYTVIRGLVAAGLGVALVPALGLGPAEPGVAVRPVAGEPLVREVHVAVRGPKPTASALALRDALTRHARARA
ncbi:MAG TPA: LysR substrate-binding domain-containing protein [Solirubrobacteraceae bacterium]|jgi:DNA-binding transcriptional LysR family regulator|nr:LysR substrate-binding domain-containing protein [Solirubrobacteraceae bacterium]